MKLAFDSEKKPSDTQTLSSVPTGRLSGEQGSLLNLQRDAGNQAVQQLLRSRFLQPKLAISNPDDPEEREADNVAQTVMRSHAGAPALSPCSCSGGEMCEECQQKQSPPTISRRASAVSAPAHVPRIVSDVLRSPGRPLDSATRAFFEPRFGHDFSQVRLHSDPAAARSAQEVNALAYTSGKNIVFGPGRFSPGTQEGRQLIAHELAHVVQEAGNEDYSGSNGDTHLHRQHGPDDATPKNEDFPAWSRTSPQTQLPGDPVPGYEQPRSTYGDKDVAEFWNQLWQREKDNKANAASFVGDYSEALTHLWGRHISKVMAEAGKSAGWGLFDKLLKFVAIKTLEAVAATLLTPASVEIFEAFGAELSHTVAEIGIHAISGYGGEGAAEALEDKTKDSQIDIAKENIDRVTDAIGAALKKITVESIKGLPDVTPYGRWLGDVANAKSYWGLEKFRLPPLFPKIEGAEVRRIVAGLLIFVLSATEPPEADKNSITVEGPELADVVLHAPGDLAWSAFGFKFGPHQLGDSGLDTKVRDLPMVPLDVVLRSFNTEGIRPIAEKLMALFRAPGSTTPEEVNDFIKATGEIDLPSGAPGYLMVVGRTYLEGVSVWGGSLSQAIYLYKLGSSDSNLIGMAGSILDLVPYEVDYQKGTSLATSLSPSDFAKRTNKYIQDNWRIVVRGGEILIEKRVNNLSVSSERYPK